MLMANYAYAVLAECKDAPMAPWSFLMFNLYATLQEARNSVNVGWEEPNDTWPIETISLGFSFDETLCLDFRYRILKKEIL